MGGWSRRYNAHYWYLKLYYSIQRNLGTDFPSPPSLPPHFRRLIISVSTQNRTLDILDSGLTVSTTTFWITTFMRSISCWVMEARRSSSRETQYHFPPPPNPKYQEAYMHGLTRVIILWLPATPWSMCLEIPNRSVLPSVLLTKKKIGHQI